MSGPTAVDYVLPLRWLDDASLPELTAYLAGLPAHVRAIVVDGSPDELYDAHAQAWRDLPVRHLRPTASCRNGKVAGILTGVAAGDAEAVLLADDDVRYDADTLQRVVDALSEADLVGPQNVLPPTSWHARWDTARSLLNRALGADYPGSFAVRRSTFEAMGGYDGDVLFENLELMRTVEAYGGTVARPLDLYVPRLPPTAGHFVGQRVRQAYDDLAQPGRLAAELAILPTVLGLAATRPRALLGLAAAAVAAAEIGRRRAGGRRHFPATASAWAPLWLLERGVCVWVAVALRLGRGGMPYAGHRLRLAAHSPRYLRRRAHAAPQSSPSSRWAESPATNRPVTWEPSQNGSRPDRPQRHSATVRRPGSSATPSWSKNATVPRTISGPSR